MNKRCDIKNSEFLDLIIDKDLKYHGNYVAIKHGEINKTIDYILKNVTFKHDRENIIYSEKYESFLTDNCNLLSIDAWLIKQAEIGDIRDTLKRLKEIDPARYFKHSIAIEKTMRTLHLREIGYETKFKMDKKPL